MRSCRSAAVKCRPDSEDVHGRHTVNIDGQLACWKLACSSEQTRIIYSMYLGCVSCCSEKKIQFTRLKTKLLSCCLVFGRLGWLFSMLSASLMMTKCGPLLVFVRPHASSHCVKAIDLLTLPANVRIWLYLKKRTEAHITCWLHFQQDHLQFRTKSIFKRKKTAVTDTYNRPFCSCKSFWFKLCCVLWHCKVLTSCMAREKNENKLYYCISFSLIKQDIFFSSGIRVDKHLAH